MAKLSKIWDGTDWVDFVSSVPNPYPDQEGNANRFLSTDGEYPFWSSLPDYLTPSTASVVYVIKNSTDNELVQLDRMQFDGISTRFIPTYNGASVTITSPLRLFMSINGIMQSVRDVDNVWLCEIQDPGFIIDSQGYVSFTEAPQPGSVFDGRLMPATNIKARSAYPFKALNILLGV
jgi:hypothetical protein